MKNFVKCCFFAVVIFGFIWVAINLIGCDFTNANTNENLQKQVISLENANDSLKVVIVDLANRTETLNDSIDDILNQYEIGIKVYKDTLKNYIVFRNAQQDSLLKIINNTIVTNIDSIYARIKRSKESLLVN